MKETYLHYKRHLAGYYFDYVLKEFKAEGCRFEVPRDLTDRYFRGAFALGWYEKEERKYLKEHLPAQATVLELGGCLGVVSCIANRLLADPSQHVVVEANPRLVPWIEKNRSANGAGFTVEHCMLSEQPVNDFYLHDQIVCGSNKHRSGQRIQVPGLSPEQLQQKHGLHFDHLIMDIEGGELFFFRNHQPFLSQLKAIYMEIHPFEGILTDQEAQECEQILQGLGFSKELQDGYFQIWKKN